VNLTLPAIGEPAVRDQTGRDGYCAETAMAFAIKAEIRDAHADTFAFAAQKTMYGGKHVAAGDIVFLFASGNEGGQGLVARGVVTSAEPVPKRPGVARQTPRVSITVTRTARAARALGRAELRSFTDWQDGRPESELNFKFYRQATNKIVGLSDAAAAFLEGFFRAGIRRPRPPRPASSRCPG
jgi:hypothetical protein